MASPAYMAIVERGKRGYGVFFPDLPGCVSAGLTEREVFAGAEDALAGHLAEMLIEGETPPARPKRSRAIPRSTNIAASSSVSNSRERRFG